MNDKSLAGKQIAVLVENQYIPEEVKCYQDRFATYGAEVHLMSRLWGQPRQTFVSEVEEAGKTPETLDVSLDFEHVNLDDYAAVIITANYTSVRLRWNPDAATSNNPGEAARNAPAVRFFRRAMQNPKIIKGAPCHGLWLLTPSTDLLAGRRITCNPVVLADAINAGALYVPAPADSDWYEHVVVDRDLVTNMSAVHDGRPLGTERLVDTICQQILRLPSQLQTEPMSTVR